MSIFRMSAAQQQSRRQGKSATSRVGPVGTLDEADLAALGLFGKSTAVRKVQVATHGESKAVNVNAGLKRNSSVIKATLVEERHGQVMQGQQALSQQFQQGIKLLQDQAMANLDFLSKNLAKFSAEVQNNIIQLNKNLLTVQGNILLKMKELEIASGARHEELKGELEKLKIELEGINKEINGMKGDITGIKGGLQGLADAAKGIQKQIDEEAAKNQAARKAAEDAAQGTRPQGQAGAQNPEDDVPSIEVYSCTCCGGSVNSFYCSANTGNRSTRVRMLISPRKFKNLQQSLALENSTATFGSTDASGGSYRIIIRDNNFGNYDLAIRQIFHDINNIQ